MPKRVTIEPHLSVEELENSYRQASEPVKRTHYQIILNRKAYSGRMNLKLLSWETESFGVSG